MTLGDQFRHISATPFHLVIVSWERLFQISMQLKLASELIVHKSFFKDFRGVCSHKFH